MSKSKHYIPDYENSTNSIKIGEYDILLPVQPPDKDIINFGLKPDNQYFKRTEIPKNLKKRKQVLTFEEQEFIQLQYHKRKHGEWQFINGKPIYFTGLNWYFLNYWICKDGSNPDFKYSQTLLFLFWYDTLKSENDYGMMLVKPRRIGGTEFTLCDQYEFASRKRGVNCGMQSKDDDSAKKNFKRLMFAHKNMMWFMRPINKGSNDSEEALIFSYPEIRMTERKLKQDAENEESGESLLDGSLYESQELGSMVDYKPSTATQYDGERLGRYTLNEFGKLEKMSSIECWAIVRYCLHLDNGKTLVGKAILESTIEELNDGKALEDARELWADSDPTQLDENGRTISGLRRLFLSAIDCAEADEYGFPKAEETREFLNNLFKALKEQGKTARLAKEKRKAPMTIEDALMPSGSSCQFNVDNINEALDETDWAGNGSNSKTVRGNLMRKGNLPDGEVYFQPSENGRWLISQLPEQPNAIDWRGGVRLPACNHLYAMGTDPYDNKETVDKRQSKGAFIVGRKLDILKDSKRIDMNNMPLYGGLDMETYQPVCTYYHRHPDPRQFFEDCLMTSDYYSVENLFENNKMSIRHHYNERGRRYFLQSRPEGTKTSYGNQDQENEGVPATEKTIGLYFDLITSYVESSCRAIKHRDLLLDLLGMNYQSRGKHDLGVAFGWMLVAMTTKYEAPKKQDETIEWFDFNQV